MDLLDQIFKAGVVGAGGAGFPTHVKLNCKVEYLILNGSECEPLLATDKYLMRTKAKEIIETLEKIAELIEAKKIVIGLKHKYKSEIESLQLAIKNMNSRVELHYLDNFYPAGDEQILVYEITGKTIPPAGIPLHVGAVVSNVGTVVNINEALNNTPVMYSYVSVLGEIRNPVILKVPIGTPIIKCIEEAGGSPLNDYSIILGGPMMGKILNKSDLEHSVITKTNGAIIVVPDNHYLVERDKISIEHIINRAKSACIQCSYCTQFCPRYLIGHPIEPHKIMRTLSLSKNEEIIKETQLCSECGVCELYACPMGLSPRQVNIFLKNELREKGFRYKNTESEFYAREGRENRKIPTKRLMARVDVIKYYGQEIEESKEIFVSTVKIPLQQHIGKSATSLVNIGEMVTKGQQIGSVEKGELGANIHASISGKVVEVNNFIVIENEKMEDEA
ncbi:4Fe-4S dicluster domain-containing protein [Oceanirhabdus seepicola]|uniref:4Fe-4S dicluster domain-containing protein n=1 Tax=Oceanirhabdus seepicola TaxID=2828781 RepID=A0A9J6P0A2_9CLOT|nr:4Fe-4S dicluster domain-containing protein [Oceanirhabdus seepicola]MCM1990191.1 4Fe-4S dicluster domain-containing protein [Oceanirhabdus seepicola]